MELERILSQEHSVSKMLLAYIRSNTYILQIVPYCGYACLVALIASSSLLPVWLPWSLPPPYCLFGCLDRFLLIACLIALITSSSLLPVWLPWSLSPPYCLFGCVDRFLLLIACLVSLSWLMASLLDYRQFRLLDSKYLWTAPKISIVTTHIMIHTKHPQKTKAGADPGILMTSF